MKNIFYKILQHKYWFIVVLFLFAGITYLASLVNYRIDLTADKRFTLSPSTKKLLTGLDSVVTIQVFLTGELPADFKKLSNATKDLLDEFRDISHDKIKVVYARPAIDLNDSTRIKQLNSSLKASSLEDWKNIIEVFTIDSLKKMGVAFDGQSLMDYNNKTKSFKDLQIPSAMVFYQHKKFVVDLRSSREIFKNFNVLNDNSDDKIDKQATLNAAESLLEFKFANAIDKLTRKYVPAVAYVVGNGEPIDLSVNDLGESLRNDYRLGIFDLKKGYPNPDQLDALIIVKPTIPFTEEDKLKIDQFIMHGGKVIWFIDKLYAELDSLMRSQADFIAFDRNLNLNDILFKYGVRINSDLLQDLDCSKIPIVTGYNPDKSPQFERFPWPYYPFLYAPNDNPISKNLDRVLPIFPSSMDTVQAIGIHKTVLLASDTNSRVLSSPALVSLNSVKDEADFQSFNRSYLPVAVLLEGKFKSLYANRLTRQVTDSVQKSLGLPFLDSCEKPTRQIVVSDADIVTNAVSHTSGPLPMGELEFDNYRFANREFFLNSIDYLVSTSRIFESRNKNFVLRLLDRKKVESQRTTWQFINIIVPILLIMFFGAVFQWLRKNKYAA